MFMIRGFGTEAFMNNPQCFRHRSVSFWAHRIRIRNYLHGSGFGSGSFHHQAKIVRRILILLFYDFKSDFLSLKNNGNLLSKSNRQIKKYFCWHLEGHWRKEHELDPDPLVRGTDPDPYPNVMDPEHWSEHWFICFPDPLVRGTDELIRIRIRIPNVTDPEHCRLPKIRTSYRRLFITKEESDRAEARVRMLGGGIVCSAAVLLLTPDCCGYCCCGYCCCSLCFFWRCCCCSCCRCCCCRWAASSCRISLEGGAGLEKLPTSWLWPVLP